MSGIYYVILKKKSHEIHTPFTRKSHADHTKFHKNHTEFTWCFFGNINVNS